MGASPLAGKFLKAIEPSSLQKLLKAFNPPPLWKFPRKLKKKPKKHQ
jgi:hypothetical protein